MPVRYKVALCFSQEVEIDCPDGTSQEDLKKILSKSAWQCIRELPVESSILSREGVTLGEVQEAPQDVFRLDGEDITLELVIWADSRRP